MESEYLIQRRAKMLGLSKPEPEKEPTKIKPMAKKRQTQSRQYAKIRKQFLIKHPRCQVKGCNQISTEVHHKAGRIGELLTDDKYFLAVCHDHYTAIEQDPQWAKENDYSISRLKTK